MPARVPTPIYSKLFIAIGASAPCVDLPGAPPARVINMSLGMTLGTTLDQVSGLADALDCALQDVVVLLRTTVRQRHLLPGQSRRYRRG
jgi:hypothetical protein